MTFFFQFGCSQYFYRNSNWNFRRDSRGLKVHKIYFEIKQNVYSILSSTNWRLRGAQPLNLLEHHNTIVLRDLRGALNWWKVHCWNECKVNFPIFIFWVMDDCIYNMQVTYLNFHACWIEWKINFPIFIFRIMADCIAILLYCLRWHKNCVTDQKRIIVVQNS